MALIHKMSVKSRKISIANRNFVQGGINSDVFQIELDQEFTDCERVLVSMKRDDSADDPIVFELPENKRINIPSELMSEVGTFTVGVIGYDADGNARVTTEAIGADKACSVVEASFIVDSENPPSEEQQDIFQQLGEFVKDAQASLDKFDDASMSIGTVETLEPGTQATANFTGEGLQKVLNLGIPQGLKGDKGDKGDPGEQGIQGIPGVDGQDGQDGAPGADGFSPTVEVSKDGSVTTISITDKTGPKTAQISDGAKGDKGDKGDPGEKGDPGAPGADGQNGADGFSPTVDVSKSGTVTTISIADKTGVKTAEISDGAKGDKGDTGVGIPDGGTTGDFVWKTATGTGWFNSEGLLRASYIGTLQQIGDEGQSLEIHDVSVTSNGYIAGIDSADPQTDGSYVYARDSNVVSASEHRVGVKDGAPYVSLQSTPPSGMEDVAASDGVYTYVDDIDKADEVSEASSVTNLSIPTSTAVKKYVATHATTNILTGTATGSVAHAEDAYAAKPRGVRVKGRTVNNLWPVFNGSNTGVTASTDDTGLITVSGTSTALVRSIITVPIPAQAGKTYTVVTTSANSGMDSLSYEIAIDASRSASDNDFISNMFAPTAGGRSKTFTTPDGTAGLACVVRVDSGLTVDASFRVMLVEGAEVPDCFTPTGTHSVQPDKLVMAGKNLLPQEAKIYHAAYNGGRAYLKNREAQFPLTIQVESEGYGLYIPVAIGEQYTISLDGFNNEGFTGAIFWAVYQNEEDVFDYRKELQHGETTITTTITTTTTGSFLVIVIAGMWTDGTTNVGTFNKVATGLRVELGSTATAYEPPSVTEVALPETDPLMDGDALTIAQDGAVTASRADGTIEQLGTVQLPQLPAPTFNVYPTGGDVPGETSVDYERDVNIAFKNLEEIVNGLIGD